MFLAALTGCAETPPAVTAAATPPPPVAAISVPAMPQADETASATGIASYYRSGPGLHRTCSGARLDNSALTAASPNLPVGTTVQVTRLDDDRSVTVLVNDCMPPADHRILDLSVAAAKQLGLMHSGVAEVSVTPMMMAASGP